MTNKDKYKDKNLDLDSYDFELPRSLIAQRPMDRRDESRLLIYDEQKDLIIHEVFKNISNYLPTDSTLIFNESKVFPCRLIGKKESGGKCEVFILSLESDNETFPALVKTSGKKKQGDKLFFEDGLVLTVQQIPSEQGHFYLRSNTEDLKSFLMQKGLVPIPPYIRDGISDEQDKESYQTVYAKNIGSVAAPTAGLHFTHELLTDLEAKGFSKAFLNLHVGLGTFAPVKVENLLEHKMHKELYFAKNIEVDKINHSNFKTAVGTTSLRAMESCVDKSGKLQLEGGLIKETDIFIYPGKAVVSVDALITNFHLPKSTLLMLVSALVGREKLLSLYKEAIKEKYRFFSYGDSMLILRDPEKVKQLRQ